MKLVVKRTARRMQPPTRSARQACAMLGVVIDDLRPRDRSSTIAIDLPSGRRGTIITLGGPSGGGKSTLLRDIARAMRVRGWHVIDAARIALRAGGCLDAAGGRRDVTGAMARLSRAGLADARCFAARANELSEGQRFRLRVSVALHRAERLRRRAEGDRRSKPSRPPRRASPRVAVLIDEFASGLDDVCARTVAASLRRIADDQPGLTIIAASARPEALQPLEPDVMVDVALDGTSQVRAMPRPAHPEARSPGAVRIGPGAMRDYAALSVWHYRPAAPGPGARVLVARDRLTGERAGVLVVTRPVLNGSWRRHAWGARYSGADRRAAARRLNREVRCISRVVVDPRWRGTGVARALVHAYLARPLTRRTEAVAAMGRFCPFFRAAGMREHRLPAREADIRLLRALASAGIPRWRLALPRDAWARVNRARKAQVIARELRIWANRSRATIAARRLRTRALFEAACRRVNEGLTAYTHDGRHPSGAPPGLDPNCP